MVNNVFAYGPDGKVFFAAINFPGSWADGSLTARFLGHLKAKIGEYKICVDQGFPRSGDAYGTLVGPVTKRATRRLHRDVRDYLLRISNVRTSLRQASEWGMHGLQGTFPRCKKRLPSDSEQRRLVLALGTVRLKVYLTLNMFALRTSTVTTKFLNITSVQGITIVMLTGVVTGVMTNS
jgi:hypothetical protein